MSKKPNEKKQVRLHPVLHEHLSNAARKNSRKLPGEVQERLLTTVSEEIKARVLKS